MNKTFQKTALAAGIATALLGTSGAVNAGDFSGAYCGVGLAVSSLEGTANNYYGEVGGTDFGSNAGIACGYNWQNGSSVIGVEADVNTGNSSEATTGYSSGYYYQETEWNWYSTIRGRAGIATDNSLLYVTGGLAIVDADHEYCYNGPSCSPSTSDGDAGGEEYGIAFGAGVETDVAENTSVKVEFMHIELETNNTHRENGDPLQFDSSMNTLRVGVQKRFK